MQSGLYRDGSVILIYANIFSVRFSYNNVGFDSFGFCTMSDCVSVKVQFDVMYSVVITGKVSNRFKTMS